jgi:hypothetical protein
MKRIPVKLFILMFLLMSVSCNEPETVVTNYIHSDGSITRVIVMKSISEKAEDRFKISDLQVPFDSTWTVKDSTEQIEKGGTLYVRRAEKNFKNIEGINLLYKLDSGANKEVSRHAGLRKMFRWFNTEYRFSENIDQQLKSGYPVSQFLNAEELTYFYSPESLKSEKEQSPDSLKFRALADSVKLKTDRWTINNLILVWIGEFTKQIAVRGETEITNEYLTSRENDLLKMIEKHNDKFDSLWRNGFILKEIIGADKAGKYQAEADSSISVAINSISVKFTDYSVKAVLPGNLTGTNGFVDSSKVLLWPVKADYFLTQPYEMWAESKVPNRWAWIVSGLFLVFVLTGVILRIIKRG